MRGFAIDVDLGEQRKRDAVVDLAERRDRLLVAAKAEIESEMQRAKDALRSQVADLAMAGAEKILARAAGLPALD